MKWESTKPFLKVRQVGALAVVQVEDGRRGDGQDLARVPGRSRLGQALPGVRM
jgi:hypothetical protein